MRLKAEVIAIGDELTSGQRLDTNSQWISQRLGDLGIEVAFHTTVGDVLPDNVDVFRIAASRVDIVVSTGGLGPTADDLTRQAIADFADVELVFCPEVVSHIEKIFSRYARAMPKSNLVQAYFPVGSTIIDNPEGTAPGIDFPLRVEGIIKSRIFALPGVPAEMKQMWDATVESAIQTMTGEARFIHHYVLHCFGVGESQAETMLPHMIRRGRIPKVGITASDATISFRITMHEATEAICSKKMQPTIQEIRDVMGDLVFGENGQELEEVVSHQLLETGQSVAILDIGLHGDVARKLVGANLARLDEYFKGGLVLSIRAATNWMPGDHEFDLPAVAKKIRQDFGSDIGVAVGPPKPSETDAHDQFDLAIDSSSNSSEAFSTTLAYSGHSELRQIRSVKQVLNHIRLFLKSDSSENDVD